MAAVVVATCLWQPNEASFEFSRCYDEEWVRRLYEGVKRNTRIPFEFILFRDRPYDIDVSQVQLTEPCGYHSMIEPFKLDRPMLLMGLDAVITGNIDALLEYCLIGQKMLLPRDPFFPSKVCNGVALVPAGYKHIHERHNGENDMEWLRQQDCELIENLFPGQVRSYKGHVKKEGLDGARIVYFHGREKPHEVRAPWLAEHWGGPVRFHNTLNNAQETILEQIRQNIERGLPRFREAEAHDRTATIVGGGPSLAQNIERIRGDVFALNNTHDYLLNRDIIPDYHVMLDSRPENVAFITRPNSRTRYLMAAACHPDVFDALEGFDVTIWCNEMDDIHALLQDRPDEVLVGGGATVGMKTMYLAYLMGYRHLEFVGFDSCYMDGAHHAYRQDLNDGEQVVEITAAGRTFRCAPWMAKQAQEFQVQARKLLDLGCTITVHGSGLIPWIMYAQQRDNHARDAREPTALCTL